MILGTTISTGVLIGMLYSAGQWIDQRYAHNDDVQLIDMRLEQKIQSDRIYQIRQQLFQMEREYPKGLPTAPPSVQDQYRRLQAALEDAIREQDRLMEQQPRSK